MVKLWWTRGGCGQKDGAYFATKNTPHFENIFDREAGRIWRTAS